MVNLPPTLVSSPKLVLFDATTRHFLAAVLSFLRQQRAQVDRGPPNAFMGGKFIGGDSDVHKLNKSGNYLLLLEQKCASEPSKM